MGKFFALLCLFVAVVAVLLFMVQQVWTWVIPDLFPGAVEQGLIAGEISLWIAFKLEILLFVLVASGQNKSN